MKEKSKEVLFTARLPSDEVLAKLREAHCLPVPGPLTTSRPRLQEARKGLLLTYKACLGTDPSLSSEQ